MGVGSKYYRNRKYLSTKVYGSDIAFSNMKVLECCCKEFLR
nr:MAG TPA: hypothetical protein [Caudoviricetes sp.]DAO50785.1 MAG TPA: hypothetical protein [Caudoviricetes sp.]DAS86143.1 MAG TPA: hypothetical protein [Caudoviricetes sp.]